LENRKRVTANLSALSWPAGQDDWSGGSIGTRASRAREATEPAAFTGARGSPAPSPGVAARAALPCLQAVRRPVYRWPRDRGAVKAGLSRCDACASRRSRNCVTRWRSSRLRRSNATRRSYGGRGSWRWS